MAETPASRATSRNVARIAGGVRWVDAGVDPEIGGLRIGRTAFEVDRWTGSSTRLFAMT
jgi:hypothetical protein